MQRKKCKIEGCRGYVWARDKCKKHDIIDNPEKYKLKKSKTQKKGGKGVSKPKKRTLVDLKKELWFWTSLLTRLSNTDDQGYVYCIVRKTKHYYWKDGIQAGHFIRKSQGGCTKYCRYNIFPQSAASNLIEEQYLMGKEIQKLYSKGLTKYTPDQLYKRNKTEPFKEDRFYLESTIQEYKKEVLEISEKKNLWEWKEKCLKKYLKEEK